MLVYRDPSPGQVKHRRLMHVWGQMRVFNLLRLGTEEIGRARRIFDLNEAVDKVARLFGDVCYRAAAKLASTAEIGALQTSTASSGPAAFCEFPGAFE